jgi:hypothetical protein
MSGDIVNLWQVSTINDTSIVKSYLLLDRILILDVLPVPAVSTDDAEKFPYVIILAVPMGHQAEILNAMAKGALVFTLDP